MGYTLNWRRHNASDIAWANSARIIRKVNNPLTKLEAYDWGFAFTYDNNDDSICCISRDDNITFTKPNDEITPDLMKALIIMTEFGIISEVGHSSLDMSDYITALKDVHTKHTLVSYDFQYAKFGGLIRMCNICETKQEKEDFSRTQWSKTKDKSCCKECIERKITSNKD